MRQRWRESAQQPECQHQNNGAPFKAFAKSLKTAVHPSPKTAVTSSGLLISSMLITVYNFMTYGWMFSKRRAWYVLCVCVCVGGDRWRATGQMFFLLLNSLHASPPTQESHSDCLYCAVQLKRWRPKALGALEAAGESPPRAESSKRRTTAKGEE